MHLSRSQVSGEPGPAVPTTSTDLSFDAAELEFFRSLPEEDLQSLYPSGIRPPPNLGPVTPYDRYDQFHLAILHLAAGVTLPDVVRVGGFGIDDNQFVRHMAIFCAQSLDYTDRDHSRLRGKLLEINCTHVPGEQYCMQCARIEFISLAKPPTKQIDAFCNNRSSTREEHPGSNAEEKGTRTAKHKRAQSILCHSLLVLFLKYILPTVAIWFLYESQIRPLFTNSGEVKEPTLKMQAQTLTVDGKTRVMSWK